MSLEAKKKRTSPTRKFLSDSLIAVAVSILLMLVCELILRVFAPQNLSGDSIIGETFSSRDEILGMRYRPYAKWRFTHPEYKVYYEINEHGLRDKKNHPMPKPDETVRILLVGDSFTFGQGVNYDDIWPVIVEKRVQAIMGKKVDFVKAGIQGLDTRSEFILIQRMVERFDCDVVLMGFLINDVYTNTPFVTEEHTELSPTNGIAEQQKPWFRTMKQVFISNDRHIKSHLLTFFRRLVITSDEMYCRLYLASPKKSEWLQKPLLPNTQSKIEITEALFKGIAAYCHLLQKKLIVLSIPQQFQVLYYEKSLASDEIDVNIYDDHFAKVAEQNDFEWVETLSGFVSSDYAKDELFYRLDGHLTPAGHGIVAERFVEKVVPLLQEAM
jgi:hypothetical protein